MTDRKIRIQTSIVSQTPILVWHPYARGETFQELSLQQAKELLSELNDAIEAVEGKDKRF